VSQSNTPGNSAGPTLESVSTGQPHGQQAQQAQLQITIDDSATPVIYSANVRVSNTAEEIFLDFAGGLRPTGQNSAVLKVDERVVMNPWAAKRLALALHDTIARYEQTYGELELDARKRVKNTAGLRAP
jgi:hypothetical protein